MPSFIRIQASQRNIMINTATISIPHLCDTCVLHFPPAQLFLQNIYVKVYAVSVSNSKSTVYLEKNKVAQLVEASQINHQYCINISWPTLMSGHSTCRSQKSETFIEVSLSACLNANWQGLIPFHRLGWLHPSLSCCLVVTGTVTGLAEPDVVGCACLLHL